MALALNYDTLILVAKFLAVGDSHTLCQLSLVNKAFNDVTRELLYKRVVLAPAETSSLQLGQRQQQLGGQWVSARLPHNVALVKEFYIGGYLSTRASPFNNFCSVVEDSILAWQNLQTVIFTPRQYHPDLFTKSLPSLRTRRYLRNLTVNASCCSDVGTPLLVQIEGLESLTIANPTRAVLQALPDWLPRLHTTLQTFHLEDDCGSVTPGVLKSFLPHMSRIKSFGLGLSYSITNDDAFSFLTQLPSLTSLEFRYYPQMRQPSVQPILRSLRFLTIHYLNISTRLEADYLGKWIRRLSARSPIESFSLIPGRRDYGPQISLDGLADHISLNHAQTLRTLILERAFIGLHALAQLCARCILLEELAVGTSAHILTCFTHTVQCCVELRTASIWTLGVKKSKVQVDSEVMKRLMRDGSSRLRRVIINDIEWEGAWVSTSATDVEYSVERTSGRKDRR